MKKHKWLQGLIAMVIALAMLMTLLVGCAPSDSGGSNNGGVVVDGDKDNDIDNDNNDNDNDINNDNGNGDGDVNEPPEENPPVTEDEVSPIVSVKALGFVDVDGPKVNGVALGYDQDMTGAQISADTYTLTLYNKIGCNTYFSDGTIGQITKWYINSEPVLNEDAEEGSGSGNYVILEVFTDYIIDAEADDVDKVLDRMLTRATQVGDIALPNGSVIKGNNVLTANVTITKTVNPLTGKTSTTYGKITADSYYIPDIEGFKFYVDEELEAGLGRDGDAFLVEHCFNQQDGKYYDEHVAYALYVPEDWNENGTYAMVTLENPAAGTTTHPVSSALFTRSPSYYASEEAQNLVKEQHGVDGMIVVVPVVRERVNDNGGTTAEYVAIVHLWDYLIEKYNVDENYIYGSGQSVGGMILIETQRLRDNFFAGLLLYDDQWIQNYYVDTLYVRGIAASGDKANSIAYHYPLVDSSIIWDYHYGNDGEKVYVEDGHDPYNMYYLISDDNMLVVHLSTNELSIDNWNEMSLMWQDLTGNIKNKVNEYSLVIEGEINKANLAAQNKEVEDFLTGDKDGGTRNVNGITISGESQVDYSMRMYNATYEWLLSQTRQSEMERDKLDINKPFDVAEEQIQTDDRLVHFLNPEDGSQIYFVTGKEGAGSQGYNAGWYNLTHYYDNPPGWLPTGMGSWLETDEDGNVSASDYKAGLANIVSAQLLDGGKAIAIQYSEDMSDININLKGDPILKYGSTTEYRDDFKIEVAPYIFYNADGEEIECEISKVYVNSVPATDSEAELRSGSGNYVIIEFAEPISDVASVSQATTIHTSYYIASALPWKYDVA